MTTRLPLSQLTRTQLIQLTNVPIIDMSINNFLDAWLEARQVWISNGNNTESMVTMARCKEACEDAKKVLKCTLDAYVAEYERTESFNAMNNKLACENRLLTFKMLMVEFNKYKRGVKKLYDAKPSTLPTVPTGLAGFTFAEAS